MEKRNGFFQNLQDVSGAQCRIQSGIFRPYEMNAVFDPNDLEITINYSQGFDKVLSLLDKLSIVIEKEGQFVSDFSLQELKDLDLLEENHKDERIILSLTLF